MPKNILIIGGGFAGLNLAKGLANHKQFKVTLIDRRNYHLFQPLLYQVATAGLSPADIAVPLRSLLSFASNISVLLGEVLDIDLNKKEITVQTHDSFKLNYDVVVFACGASHSYFGNDKWEENSPGLKTLEQATEIRRRILMAFEEAERENNIELKKEWLSFVIVGGGPTGVELAGAIGEISRTTLSKDFKNIDPTNTRIILIEAGNRILSAFDHSLSRKAARDLESLGVQIWTNSKVTEIDSNGVQVGAEFFRAKTVIWAAGVTASKINQILARQGATLDSINRVHVDPFLRLMCKQTPLEDCFILGDQANVQMIPSKQALPGLCPVAIQQGQYLSKYLLGINKLPFQYVDKGIMATIGRKKAIAEIGKIKLSGFIAWCAWLFVHIFYLIGFKNRFFVFMQWVWSYITFSRGARLITGKNWKLND